MFAGGGDGLFDSVIHVVSERLGQAFRLVEQRQLRCRGIRRLFGLAAKQALAKQRDLFLQLTDRAQTRLALAQHFSQ